MLAAAMLCLASLAQAPPGRPAALRGTVVEQGTNRPLAGVTVRIADGFDVPTATTDARGRFDGLPPPDAVGVPIDGQTGPMLRVRAEDDRAWPWSLPRDDNEVGGPPEFRRNQVIWTVYEQQVSSRWRGQGPLAELVVTCPPVGEVQAVVRGPDGRPLADTPIVLVPGRGDPFFSGTAVHVSGRTDQAGSFRIREFEGAREFSILVSGVGFGSTGLVEVRAGQVCRPEIPPLAKFARVEGRVDEVLRTPGTRVQVVRRLFDGGASPAAALDEEGRFALGDLVPGDYSIRLVRGEQSVPTPNPQFGLGPGQVLRDVVVSPAPPPPPELERERQRMVREMAGEPGRIVAWVEGTVRDEEGRPLAGARVFARVEYFGGMRANSDVRQATTDAEGRYRIEGPSYPMIGTLSVLVVSKGRPPIVAHAPGHDPATDPEDRKPARLDVAVGARGGSLAVKVLEDGRKAPGATVSLASNEADRIFAEHVRPVAPAEQDEMREFTVPTAVAGADGVARFENVAPGVYDAIARQDVDPNQPFAKMAVRPGAAVPRMGPAQGFARGIEIPPGGRVETAVAIEPEPSPARFLVLGPDGAPVANRTLSVGVSRGRATSGSTTIARTDGRGECVVGLQPGRWTLDFRYQDSEPKSFPIQAEPFYQAEIHVPASPALADAEPIALRAGRRERGALKVRLLGADGTPARGGVAILPQFPGGGARQGGAVDAAGWVRFADMTSGTYRLRGFVDGSDPAPRPQFGRKLPDDALTGRVMIFDRLATVEPGAESAVELRTEPVGYVRATIRPPADRSPTDYTAALRGNELPGEFPTFEVSVDRTDYLFGPVPTGRWPVVVVAAAMGDDGKQPRIEREVEVEPGRVVRIDVEAPAGAARVAEARRHRHALVATGGIDLQSDGPEAVAVTVFMADGATPAFGARALFIAAGASDPVLTGTADAAGRLTWTGVARPARQEGEEGPEPAAEPTILTWAPGVAGPAVATVRPGEPLRLTLPAPAGASGRATIDGAAVGGRDARIRVVCAAEGKGAVAAAMRRETTADAEGRFRFPALAPGRYVVQAVRDELWASKPVPLVIEPDRQAPPIDLDVPAPGATVALELVDRQGRPIAAAFTIDPPAGPIAELVPVVGRTDGDGRAIVRGLPTGILGLNIEDAPSPFALDVPPARSGAGPLDVRVEVARRGP